MKTHTNVSYSQLEVGDQFRYRGAGDAMTVTGKIECDGTILVAARNERTSELDGRAVDPGWRVDKVVRMPGTHTPIAVARDIPPDTIHTDTYGGILDAVGDGRSIRLIEVQGISTTHSVYYYYDTGLMVYVYAPQSGPYNALREFAAKERGFPAWKAPADASPSEQTQYGATLYALNEATREIARELDTEVVTS